MLEILILAGLLLGLGAVAAYWRNARIRALARQRMERAAEAPKAAPEAVVPLARSFLVRHRSAPWVMGLLTAGIVYFAVGWTLPYVISISLIVILLGGRLEAFWAAAQIAKIETQLAQAIDLMVAASAPGRACPNPWKTPWPNRTALCVPNWRRWWGGFVMATIPARSIAD